LEMALKTGITIVTEEPAAVTLADTAAKPRAVLPEILSESNQKKSAVVENTEAIAVKVDEATPQREIVIAAVNLVET